jgi:hypothetical protein
MVIRNQEYCTEFEKGKIEADFLIQDNLVVDFDILDLVSFLFLVLGPCLFCFCFDFFSFEFSCAF